jgi:hypothetical protein
MAAAVFFLRRQSILHRAQGANVFADLDDLSTKFLKAMERFHFPLSLAQCLLGVKRLSDGLTLDLASEPKIGTVARIVAFGTMASDFAALTGCGGEGTSSEIAESRKLTEQIGSLGLQLRQGVGHSRASCSLASIYAKNCVTKKDSGQSFISKSHALTAGASCKTQGKSEEWSGEQKTRLKIDV